MDGTHDLARERVWIALSDLYLDNDVEDAIVPCAHALATSPFTREQLRDILFDEVHPALVYNLMSVAGEWQGFDEAWLTTHIRRRMAAWWAPIHVARWLRRGEIGTLWSRVDAIIAVLRTSRLP